MMPSSRTRESQQFLVIGIQYYLTGRQATLCGLMPVSGNLVHHAIEMILKAGLLERFDSAELKKDFHHRLPKIWSQFKNLAADSSLGQFDELITEIHKWAEIRYPYFPRGKALAMTAEILRFPRTIVQPDDDLYTINLEAVDEFMKVLMNVLQVNPEFLKTVMLRQESRDLYERENRHKIWP